MTECTRIDSRHAVGDYDILQFIATIERTVWNGCYRIRKFNGREFGTTLKGVPRKFRDIFGNGDVCDFRVIGKAVLGEELAVAIDSNRRDCGACCAHQVQVCIRATSQIFQAVFLGVLQASTTFEGIFTDIIDAVGQLNACYARTVVKRILVNSCHAVGNNERSGKFFVYV